MFDIFADSHKIIANEIHKKVEDVYGLKLDKKKLLWGSVSPDILPKYRLIRHYQDESIEYIAKEIVKVIYIGRFLESNGKVDPITVKLLSNKIGVISHYISDYTCVPHAKRWTFTDSMIKHISYESRLNDYAKHHDFKENIIDREDIDIRDIDFNGLKDEVVRYIENIVEEYSVKESFENDLNFALNLNLKLTNFVMDTIIEYAIDLRRQLVLEF